MTISKIRSYFSPFVCENLPEGNYSFSHAIEVDNERILLEGELFLPDVLVREQTAILLDGIKSRMDPDQFAQIPDGIISTYLIAKAYSERDFEEELSRRSSQCISIDNGFTNNNDGWTHRDTSHCKSWMICSFGDPTN